MVARIFGLNGRKGDMDRRLSELPNRISTQDLTHRSRGDIHGQSPSPEISGKKQLNCLR